MFQKIKTLSLSQVLTLLAIVFLSDPLFSQDSLAAVKLFNSTDGNNWVHNENWLSDKPLSEWYGLTVLESNIVAIDLTLNHLVGEIPGELGTLSALRKLDLSNNNLSGSVPDTLKNLRNLEILNLSQNKISGEILPIISSQKKLRAVNISNNRFIGQIPKEIADIKELEFLDISNNAFHGELPNELFRLKNLVELDLHGNYFSGKVPRQISALIRLTQLDLSRNSFSGPIPGEIGKLINLKERLALDHNQLSGILPKEICSLFKLENLWLNNNHLEGILPFEIGKLTSIQSLFIYQNNLVGPLPKSIGNLRNLEILYAQNNSFGGSIPNELWFMPKLKMLKFENNQLSGSIPGDLRILQSVQSIDISNNFIDAITDTIALPGTMIYFNLSNNRIFCDFMESDDYQYLKDENNIPDNIIGIDNQNCTDSSNNSFSIETKYIDFKEVGTDSIVSRSFWISNSNLENYIFKIQNFDIDNFLVSDSLINIEPNDTVKVTITYAPIREGGNNDVVLINDILNESYQFITVSGRGIEADMPERDKSIPWNFKLHPIILSDSTDAIVKYDIPKPSTANIAIYNLGGRPIKTLVDGEVDIGFKETHWDYTDEIGQKVMPGEYLVVMQSGMFIQIQPILIIN